jgi:Ca-activated chloride channel family protein
VVARNVAIEVEFNPALVQSYRLLGYENPGSGQGERTSDTVDLVSGHAVTAFYEVVPAARERNADTGDRKAETGDGKAESRDGIGELADSPVSGIHNPVSKGLLTVRVSYQAVDGAGSRRVEFPLADRGATFADASSEFRFAAAGAEFGLVLRGSPYKSGATLADVLHWAEPAAGPDLGGDRREFISLVKRAVTLLPSQG